MKRILLLCGLLYCFNGYADVFYCPNTYQYVDIGDTPDQVQQKCGAAASKATKQEGTTQEKAFKQWIYQLSSFQGTTHDDLKLTISFDGNKVSGISVGGEAVSSTSICHSGHPIAVGDNEGMVRLNCGPPGFVNEGTHAIDTGKQEVEIWTYDFGPYQPKASFRFVNGKLESVNTQQNP